LSPDIIQHSKDSSAAFLILVCDGIWDVMDNEQVARFVSQRILLTITLDECLQQQSMDNMTVYIVKLQE
jgi:serine/threonine protein phosphatase PrpC